MQEKNLTNVYNCKMRMLTEKVNGVKTDIIPITSVHAVRDHTGKSLHTILKEIIDTLNNKSITEFITEYEELKRENAELKKEFAEIKKEISKVHEILNGTTIVTCFDE